MTARRYYAGRHTHGLEFTYDGGGWTVWIFKNKASRDKWIDETNADDCRRGYNQRSEAITRKIAIKITGDRVREVECPGGTYLEHDWQSYYNPHYWG